MKKSTLVGAIVDGFVEGTPLDIIDIMVSWSLDLSNRSKIAFFLTPGKCILDAIDSQNTIFLLILADYSEFFVTVREFNFGGETWESDFSEKVTVGGVEDLYSGSSSSSK